MSTGKSCRDFRRGFPRAILSCRCCASACRVAERKTRVKTSTVDPSELETVRNRRRSQGVNRIFNLHLSDEPNGVLHEFEVKERSILNVT